MSNKRAIVIVGAPRSGTSLLHKILRESPGTISVPHESSIIWNKHISPSRNDWKFEGAVISHLDKGEIELIRKEFNDKAMSDKKWKLWSRLGLMQSPELAKIIRWLYPKIYPLFSTLLKPDNTQLRLIEKTVHGGLWMDLIDKVLEKPIFIHLTRDGVKTIRSIANGWHEPERFGCYHLPKQIPYQDEKFQNTWCFPLIKNWENISDRPLIEIATYQWIQIQKNILDYSKEQSLNERYIRVKLEDLVDKPETLPKLLKKLDLPVTGYFEKFVDDMPKVNATKGVFIELNDIEKRWIKKQIKEVNASLNYL